MSRLRIQNGIGVEHWIDKRLREHKPIECPGNYIRIPATAWIKLQEIKNKASGKRLSLYEANREYESASQQYGNEEAESRSTK